MINKPRTAMLTSMLSTLALTLVPIAATAQTQPSDGYHPVQVGAGAPANSTALPPPRSDHDAQPQVASPVLPAGGLVEQAGVGGTTAYGRAGVLELGGNVGLNISSSQTTLTIAPSIGWFFADNLQISGILGYRFASVSSNGVSASSHALQILAEPSVHIPFSRTVFGFAGVGLGLSYVDGPGAGFALAPRLGVNIAVGRSGILTPAAQFAYSTNDAVQTSQGTLLAVSASYGLNVGYTVMW